MDRRFVGMAAAALIAASLAACGGGGGSGSGFTPGGSNAGGGSGGATPPPGVGAMTIGFALPDGAIGVVNDPHFGKIGGYTQSVYSQSLAFPPGTVVTLKNLSSGTPHTLNVLSTTGFPVNPTLSTSPAGNGVLGVGYQSGAVAPGSTVSVKLSNPGTYYIGCAFHYPDTNSMRDVLQVSSSATPGPQATPAPGNSGGGGY